MALSPYSGETNIISQLHDRPITDDGLTAAQFKAKFDKAITDFVTWFNSTFISSVQAKITVNGIVKCDGVGNASKAIAGADYQAPMTPGIDYQTPLTPGTDYQTPLTPDVDYQTPLTPGTDYEIPLNADQKRKITISSEDPTGGSDGDIWLKYEVAPEPEPEPEA